MVDLHKVGYAVWCAFGFQKNHVVLNCKNLKGDLVHASALGQHIVVVNSVKTAFELFEKRSHIYSDRSVVTMIDL